MESTSPCSSFSKYHVSFQHHVSLSVSTAVKIPQGTWLPPDRWQHPSPTIAINAPQTICLVVEISHLSLPPAILFLIVKPIFNYHFSGIFYYFIVVQLQLSVFSPHHVPPPPQPNPPPSFASTFPLGFVHVSFIVVPENPSPHCPLPPPLWLSLDFS